MTFRRLEITLGISISALAFAVYVATLCPTVDFIDAGELATVVTTLGIAHPTGYPLFTLIGWIFAHLPLGFRVIYTLNLMAAVECSAALFFFFRFLVFFLGEFTLKRISGGVGTAANEKVTEKGLLHVFVPALCGTLALAFSETFWSQSNSIEVYPLHTLFLSVILLLFTKAVAYDNPNGGEEETGDARLRRSLWLGFAYVLGLAFTNHMTTVLLAPAFLYLYFSVLGFGPKAWKRILLLAIPFAAGLSVYVYFLIRSSSQLLLNWGSPQSLERLLWHMGGKQYRVWMFSSFESASKQLSYFWATLPANFAYVPLALAIIGIWSFLLRSVKVFTTVVAFNAAVGLISYVVAQSTESSPQVFWTTYYTCFCIFWIILALKEKMNPFIFALLLFESCVLYAINYDIHDIDSYFLLAYYAVAIWIAVGAGSVLQLMREKFAFRVIAGVFVISCIVPLFFNYEKADGSKNFMVEDYTKNMFASFEPNAIVVSYQWDYFVSSAYYFQLVEHLRPDVVVIDKELMRRSWYYTQLETRYPWLVQQSRKEVDEFLRELYKFEHDLPYDSQIIEYRYAALIKSFIDRNIRARPVYVTHEIEQQYISGYQRVPSGLAFRLSTDTSFHDIPMPELKFRMPARLDILTQQMIMIYAEAYTNKALYLHYFGKGKECVEFLNRALEISPDFKAALVLKGQIMQGR